MNFLANKVIFQDAKRINFTSNIDIIACRDAFTAAQCVDALLTEDYHHHNARNFTLPYGTTQTDHLYPLWKKQAGHFSPILKTRSGFGSVNIIQLDELLGYPEDDPRRFWTQLNYILDYAEHPELRRYGFNMSANPENISVIMEQLLYELGQSDTNLLGLGPECHVGYHEAGVPLSKTTHIADLRPSSQATIPTETNSNNEKPAKAVTQGTGTLSRAEHNIIHVTGAHKTAALDRTLHAPVDAKTPSSFIRNLPEGHRATIVADMAALENIDLSNKPTSPCLIYGR